jgi:membrane protease YdiL (CAAX protease family)
MAGDLAVRERAPVTPPPDHGRGWPRRGAVSVTAVVPLGLIGLSALVPVVGSDLEHGSGRTLLGALVVLTLFAAVTGRRGASMLGLGLTTTVAAGSLLPWQIAWWPLPGLVGVAVYLFSATVTGETRASPAIRWGRFTTADIWMVVGVVLTSASALLVFFRVAPPRLGTGASLLTTLTPGSLVIAGLAFALLNALVEEVLFRGAVMHHLGDLLGWWTAAVVQAAAFGMLHLNGYPYGPVGVALAAVYGLMLGAMRLRSGGLLAPWIAHVLTDLVIFVLIVKTAT